MKNKLFIFLVLLVISAISMYFVQAVAVNAPHYFYGDITLNGADAPVGTEITATIAGAGTVGTLTTTVAGQYGGASPVDDKLAVTYSGGDGATISFNAGANELSCTSSSFSAGALTSLTLVCGAAGEDGTTPPRTSPGGTGGDPPGGGGGAAAAPAAVKILENKTHILGDEGGTIIMRVGDIAKINIKGVKHEFRLDNIGADYVEGTWRSDPINILVPLGRTVETDLDIDGVNDIFTRLESVSSDQKEATITIKPIKEEAPPPPPPEEEPRAVTAQVVIGLSIMVLIVLIGLVIYYAVTRKKKEEF